MKRFCNNFYLKKFFFKKSKKMNKQKHVNIIFQKNYIENYRKLWIYEIKNYKP